MRNDWKAWLMRSFVGASLFFTTLGIAKLVADTVPPQSSDGPAGVALIFGTVWGFVMYDKVETRILNSTATRFVDYAFSVFPVWGAFAYILLTG